MPGVQHNKKREELHRLQEKYPEQAAKLAKACGTLRRRGQQGCHLFALDGTAVCIALCPTCHRVMLTPCLQAYAPQAVNKVAPLRPVQAADVHSDSVHQRMRMTMRAPFLRRRRRRSLRPCCASGSVIRAFMTTRPNFTAAVTTRMKVRQLPPAWQLLVRQYDGLNAPDGRV